MWSLPRRSRRSSVTSGAEFGRGASQGALAGTCLQHGFQRGVESYRQAKMTNVRLPPVNIASFGVLPDQRNAGGLYVRNNSRTQALRAGSFRADAGSDVSHASQPERMQISGCWIQSKSLDEGDASNTGAGSSRLAHPVIGFLLAFTTFARRKSATY